MIISTAVILPLKISHHGFDGILHDHSLSIEIWTRNGSDLEQWKAQVSEAIAPTTMAPLEQTIGGRSFEDLGVAILGLLPDATRVVIHVLDYDYLASVER